MKRVLLLIANFVLFENSYSNAYGNSSIRAMTGFMKVLMPWDCKKISSGESMLVVRYGLTSSKLYLFFICSFAPYKWFITVQCKVTFPFGLLQHYEIRSLFCLAAFLKHLRAIRYLLICWKYDLIFGVYFKGLGSPLPSNQGELFHSVKALMWFNRLNLELEKLQLSALESCGNTIMIWFNARFFILTISVCFCWMRLMRCSNKFSRIRYLHLAKLLIIL